MSTNRDNEHNPYGPSAQPPADAAGPTQPETSAAGSTAASSAGSRPSKKTVIASIIGLIVLFILLVVGVFVAVTQFRGGDDRHDPGYVDDSGAQDNLPTPALGENDAVEGMQISIDGESAEVVPIQLTDIGTLIPPVEVNRVGWYSSSTVPGSGEKGSTVITGHINDAAQGTGYAEKFTRLQAGDEVDLIVNGETAAYRVSKEPFHVSKGDDLPAEVNDRENPNQLVLITCGGEFVGGTLGYADNIVVYADPIDAAAD